MNNNTNIDLQIENEVLATLVHHPHLLNTFYDKLHIQLFNSTENATIYEAIIDLWKDKGTLTWTLLAKKVEQNNFPHLIPHLENLSSIIPYDITTHINVLEENAVRRDFIKNFSFLLHTASSQNSIYDIRDKAVELFDNLFIHKIGQRNITDFPTLINAVQKRFENIGNTGITGLQSSLSIINKAFGGWQPSDLTIIAGRPGMGKTAFLVQQVIDMVRQNYSIGIFSLEMSNEQIASRLITNYTNIPNSSILRKGLKTEEIQRYLLLKDDLVKMPIFIDDTGSLSIQDMRLRAKVMKYRYNIDILFVDYLQLITAKASHREQEIAQISRGLKAIAKELNIPVIALSQLSREVEKRTDKRPLLSDLRDSGSIEQDADQVLFLYRPEYYGIDKWGNEYNNENTTNQIEIIIQKNRHGGILSERCYTNMATSSFINFNTF